MLGDNSGLGRPQTFSGDEAQFQRWSQEAESFFSGVFQMEHDFWHGRLSELMRFLQTRSMTSSSLEMMRTEFSQMAKLTTSSSTVARILWRRGAGFSVAAIQPLAVESATSGGRSLLRNFAP